MDMGVGFMLWIVVAVVALGRNATREVCAADVSFLRHSSGR